MISITEKAHQKLEEFADAEGLALSIRVKVNAGGCAGFTLDLFFDEIISDLDEVQEVDGVKVAIDPISNQYLDELIIDYIDNGLFGSGFKFTGPSIKGSCGCGQSIQF